MHNKQKYSKNIKGLTLVEILIGIVITTIIMAAMFTTYSIVNQTYNQVSEKAKISRSSRDLVSMLMRDIRMAGFRYYAGTQTISKFAADTDAEGCAEPGMALPKISYLAFDNGFLDEDDSHNPLVIRKNKLGFDNSTTNTDHKIFGDDLCCDQIQIVYEDFNQNHLLQPYKRYRITYFADSIDEPNDNRYAVYKTIESWSQAREEGKTPCVFPATGSWEKNCPECVDKELIRDHVEDMEFIPFDNKGLIIKDSSGNYPAPELTGIRDRLFDINGVDVRLTFRSKENFFKKEAPDSKKRFITGLDDRTKGFTDRYLRDSVIVTVNTRNIGGDLFK